MLLNAQNLKQKILDQGFSHVGIAQAKQLDAEAKKLEAWLNQHQHGEMSYMERYFDLRIDPTKLMPGAQSMIIMSLNYSPKESIESELKIAKYAYGKDYHKTIGKKLKEIIRWMNQQYGSIATRQFVDSAPVLERDWAKYAGLSWSGKNTLSINPKAGSFFFLCGIITDLKFEVDSPMKDYCGSCKKCIEACPTDALHPDGYILDATKCISYLTIEYKNQIPIEFKDKFENWIFGCDICQDVCPWNRFSKANTEPDFLQLNPGLGKDKEYWMEMEKAEFDLEFSAFAIKRTGLNGMKRNISFTT